MTKEQSAEIGALHRDIARLQMALAEASNFFWSVASTEAVPVDVKKDAMLLSMRCSREALTTVGNGHGYIFNPLSRDPDE